MSVKSNIMNLITVQPKLVTLGIGLAITFGVSLVVSGIIKAQQAHAAIPFDPDMFKRLSSRGFD
jgi:hypothetical protein